MMDAGRHEADGPVDGAGFDVEHRDEPDVDGVTGPLSEDNREHRKHTDQKRGRNRDRKHRRASTKPVPGSDPNPQPEPLRHSGDENDDRLKADKPPHWG